MLILALDQLESLECVLQSPADAIVVGLKGLSTKTRAICPLDKLETITQLFHQADKKVFLNCLKLLEEQDLPLMEQGFLQAIQAGVDGIYVADEAWIWQARQWEEEQGLEPGGLRKLLIFQPETLIASGQDAKFYLENGLQSVSMAHELSLREIEAAAAICPEIEVLIGGHYAWMSSRRPLLENYFAAIDHSERFEPLKVYTLQETMRPALLPTWQDETGTSVFSDQPIASYRQLPALAKAGIHRFRIDSLFKGNEWGVAQVETYSNILEGKPVENATEEGSDALYGQETLIAKEKTNGRN